MPIGNLKQQPAAHSSHSQVQAQPYIQQIQSYNPQLHIVQHMQPGQHQQHGDRSNNANATGHRPDGSGNQVGVFDIPIFTEEFLDHNKGIFIFPLYYSSRFLIEFSLLQKEATFLASAVCYL